MKRSFAGTLLAAITVLAGNMQAQSIGGFGDIQFWVGTGTNQSALVIDFQYGGTESATEQSWVWGYRWDGSATGHNMLDAIQAADPNLTFDSTFFVGDANYQVGSNTYEGQSDFVVEDVSWGYYIAGGSSPLFDDNWNKIGDFDAPHGGTTMPSTDQWSISTSGAADRELADGSWDAWSFGPYDPSTFEHQTPPSGTAFAAVPEPASIVFLIGLAALSPITWRRFRTFR